MKISLKHMNGAAQPLDVGDKTLIGRDGNCTISLADDDRVSRRHAAIIKKGENFWLTDLKSVNGTFLNGEQISTHQLLRNQDQIVIGRSCLSVLAGGAPPKEADFDDEATVFDRSSPETAQRLSEELSDELDEETQFLSKETLHDLYGTHAEQLYFVKGFREGESFQLQETNISIGRDSNNSLCLPCASVSGRHAIITHREQGYFLSDLGSTNGTFVNKLKLSREHLLHPGDQIQIGDVSLRFGAEPLGATAANNQPAGRYGGRKLLWAGALLALVCAGSFFLLKPVSVHETPSVASQPKKPAAPVELANPDEKLFRAAMAQVEAQDYEAALKTFSKIPPTSSWSARAVEQVELLHQRLRAASQPEKLHKGQAAPKAVAREATPAKRSNGAEQQADAQKMIRDVINLYLDGEIGSALQGIEKVQSLGLAGQDDVRQLAAKVDHGMRECLALYQAGRQDYVGGDIEAAVGKWDKVPACEAGFLDPSVKKTSTISKNIRRMMAEQLYLQVVKLVEKNEMVMAKQYCIEILKAIPQHEGCLEIQKTP